MGDGTLLRVSSFLHGILGGTLLKRFAYRKRGQDGGQWIGEALNPTQSVGTRLIQTESYTGIGNSMGGEEKPILAQRNQLEKFHEK